jgi:hypothetical protein
MQPAIYIKDNDFILSFTTVQGRVDAINLIIDALYAQMSNLANQGEPINEYTLSDGQTHIKANYKTLAQITDAISSMELRRNKLINNYQGRTTRAVDIKNFIGRRY